MRAKWQLPADRARKKANRMQKQRALLKRSTATVKKRDRYRCFRCLKIAHDVHHRRPRQMGGTSHAWINQPANLICLCRPCHRWAEEHYAEAVAQGYRIPFRLTAEECPITNVNGQQVYLTNEGTIITRGASNGAQS